MELDTDQLTRNAFISKLTTQSGGQRNVVAKPHWTDSWTARVVETHKPF